MPIQTISFTKISDSGAAVSDGVVNYGTETPVTSTAQAAQRLIALVGDGDLVGEPGERGFVISRYGNATWLSPFVSENTVADPVMVTAHGRTSNTQAGNITSDALRFSNANGWGVGNYTEASGKWTLLNLGDAIDFRTTPVAGQAQLLNTIAFTVDMQGQAGTVTLAFDGDGSTLVRSGNAWTTNAAVTIAGVANNANVVIDVVNRVLTINGVAQNAGNLWTALTTAGNDNITIGSTATEALGYSLRNLVITTGDPTPPPNRAPVGVTDNYAATTAVALAVPAAGVLGNDSDPDGNALTATLVANVTNGTLTFNANGSFTYTSNAGFEGTDSFTYTASDGNLSSATTTVNIAVTAPNTAPVANGDNYEVAEDGSLTVPVSGVLGNDTDAENHPLTAALVTGPTRGTLTLNPNGSFTYTPTANYSGPDSFTYRANDGRTNSANATVAITVIGSNDAPVLAAPLADQGASIGSPFGYVVPAGAFTDADGETLTFTATLLNGDPLPAWLTFTPGTRTFAAANPVGGAIDVTVTASDAALTSASDTFRITTTAAPPPRISFAKISDSGTAVSDGVINFGTETPVTSTALAAQRLIAIVGDGDAVGEPGERGHVLARYGDATWLDPVLTENTAADPILIRSHGQMTSTTAGNISEDALRFNATSGFGVGNYTEATGKWGLLNAGDAIDFQVTPVNGQARTLETLAFTLDMQGQTGTVTLALDGDGSFLVRSGNAWTTNAAASIANLANNSNVFIDVVNRVLTINGVTQSVPGLWTALAAAGNDNITIGAPSTETRGFSLRNMVITTTNPAPLPNREPVAVNDAFATNTNQALIVPAASGVLFNDTDADGNPLTATLVSGPANGLLTFNANGSFTYTPSNDFNGDDTFTYRVSDGQATSNTATVTVSVAPFQGIIGLEDNEISIGETDGVAYVAIVRTGDLNYQAVIDYGVTANGATAGEDFVAATGQAIMAPGVSRIVVPVTILDDNLSEPTEAITFSLITADSQSRLLFPRTTRLEILDNENPVEDPGQPPLTSLYNVVEQTVVVGLTEPMAVEFHPTDSTILFIAQKGGRIRVFDTDTGFLPDLINLSAKVNSFDDRGLMDIALHPNLAANPYLYAFYVVDPPDVTSGAAGADGTGNRFAYLSRFTLNSATNYTTLLPNSEVILIGGAGDSIQDISGLGAIDSTNNFSIPESGQTAGVYVDDYLKVDSQSHAGGSLIFGPDGMLYVATGDGTSFNAADTRSLSVQNIDSLSGKILRVNPINGDGLPDNPFVQPGDNLDTNHAKVWQLGLRNPFSTAFDSNGRLFMSNTGWNNWEELESGGPGANFGWPYFEGGDNGVLLRAPGYMNLAAGYNGALSPAAFYAAVQAGTIDVTPAYRGFSHDSSDPGFQVQAITAGDVIYTGNRYPAALTNDYFFADIVDGEVFTVDVNDRREVSYLYTTGDGPVHFTQGPDGYVYSVNIFSGEITRLLITLRAGASASIAKAGDEAPEVSLDPSAGSEQMADAFAYDKIAATSEVCDTPGTGIAAADLFAESMFDAAPADGFDFAGIAEAVALIPQSTFGTDAVLAL